jgi:hypothetical protein
MRLANTDRAGYNLTPIGPRDEPFRGENMKASGSELSLSRPAKKGRRFNAAKKEFVYTVFWLEPAETVMRILAAGENQVRCDEKRLTGVDGALKPRNSSSATLTRSNINHKPE